MSKLFVVSTFILLGGGLVGEARWSARQQTEVRSLSIQIEGLEAGNRGLAVSRDAVMNKLVSAEQDLDTLKREVALEEAGRDPGREGEIKAWLVRVKELQQRFDNRSDQRIPEMQLLNDRDWMKAAKTAGFDSDEQVRKSLSGVRNVSKAKFVSALSDALSRFTKATNGQLPRSIFDLGPYFEKPADPSMLQRYEMIKTGKVSEVRSPYRVIQEKSAIDEDYDERYTIQARGGWGSDGTGLAWTDDFMGQLKRAAQGYAGAHGGKGPEKISEVAPYLNPALAPEKLDKLLKKENGVQP